MMNDGTARNDSRSRFWSSSNKLTVSSEYLDSRPSKRASNSLGWTSKFNDAARNSIPALPRLNGTNQDSRSGDPLIEIQEKKVIAKTQSTSEQILESTSVGNISPVRESTLRTHKFKSATSLEGYGPGKNFFKFLSERRSRSTLVSRGQDNSMSSLSSLAKQDSFQAWKEQLQKAVSFREISSRGSLGSENNASNSRNSSGSRLSLRQQTSRTDVTQSTEALQNDKGRWRSFPNFDMTKTTRTASVNYRWRGLWKWACQMVLKKNAILRALGMVDDMAEEDFMNKPRPAPLQRFYEELSDNKVKELYIHAHEFKFLLGKSRAQFTAADEKRLLDLCHKIDAFKNMSVEVQMACIPTMEYTVHSKGSILIKEGCVAESIYFIVYGACTLYKTSAGHSKRQRRFSVSTLLAGSAIGHDGAVNNRPEIYTAACVTQTALLRVNIALFKATMEKNRRKDLQQKVEALSHIAILQDLPAASLMTLAENGKFKTYSPGEIVVKEGDVVDDLFFVCGGSCRAIKALTCAQWVVSSPTAKREQVKLVPIDTPLNNQHVLPNQPTKKLPTTLGDENLVCSVFCLNKDIHEGQFFPEFDDFNNVPSFSAMHTSYLQERVLRTYISEVVRRPEGHLRHYVTIVANTQLRVLRVARWKFLRLLNFETFKFILKPEKPERLHGMNEEQYQALYERYMERTELYPGPKYINVPIEKLKEIAIAWNEWDGERKNYVKEVELELAENRRTSRVT